MNTILGRYPQGFPISSSSPVIRFYGIIIVLGAILCLVVSDIRAHKDGYDYHFFDTVFMIAFPSGIVGARVWYVIASYQQEFAGKGFLNMLDIRSGGLAIQGGAIFGVIAGCLVVIFRRKGTPLLKATDFAVPTILIGQAVGRWGNFFNQEVFGHNVLASNWDFLPSFITSNMNSLPEASTMWSGVSIPEGAIAVPLFLIESIINLLFYFIIAHALPTFMGKKYRDGDATFAYFIAYGFVRMCMEPLRNPSFIMGVESNPSNGVYDLSRGSEKSLIMAFIFIGFGVLAIIFNHFLTHLLDKGIIKFKRIEPVVTKANLSDGNSSSMDTSLDFSKLKAKEETLKNEDNKKDGK